ncbi:hypothetical protein GIB67_031773 [Kingdonia uniflora]|uniref:Glucose/Sorbosone dehydrogenase domain-containing protein n=1 Tax=Kingdonia uniflora TaxID=39325 RepID=A0A7J7L4L1_9MAGN|nr:hypothetical protein GIB67_031773 [Kingdonia uniflora]
MGFLKQRNQTARRSHPHIDPTHFIKRASHDTHLIGAEVRGNVDGAFDSRYLVTANTTICSYCIIWSSIEYGQLLVGMIGDALKIFEELKLCDDLIQCYWNQGLLHLLYNLFQGRCSCNSNVNCDPSKLGPDNGGQPCQYHSVISEFTANGTTSKPSSATRANPSEVRKIFTMGLPFSGHHARQILFGPDDGYLYFMMGVGGSKGDPYNFAQNKKFLLGKIMRLDIDNIPSE